MIGYFDTSAIVKLYIAEKYSSRVVKHLNHLDGVATSRIAYPETLAAFARLQRENLLTPVEHKNAQNQFRKDWSSYIVRNVDRAISVQTTILIQKYPLRGFDSIHLATALDFAAIIEKQIHFICFDKILNRAATSEKLKVIFP
jgi:predicted nucleic acid-binding protein